MAGGVEQARLQQQTQSVSHYATCDGTVTKQHAPGDRPTTIRQIIELRVDEPIGDAHSVTLEGKSMEFRKGLQPVNAS